MNLNTYRDAMVRIEFDPRFEENALIWLDRELIKRRRIKSGIVCGGIGLAACAAAVAVALVSAGKANIPQATHMAIASPTASAAVSIASLTPSSTADTRVVVVSSDYSGSATDSYMSPEPGQSGWSEGVRLALENQSYASSYLFVRLDLFTPEEYANSFSDYVFGGRSVTEWRELAALSDGIYPYGEYNGDHGGNITEAQWKAAQEEARTLDAQADLDAAEEQYSAEITPMLTAAKAEHEEAELSRLQQLGYDVFYMNTWSYVSPSEKQYERIIAGILSADQLKRIADGSDCGYFIDWVHNGDGVVDWDESLRP